MSLMFPRSGSAGPSPASPLRLVLCGVWLLTSFACRSQLGAPEPPPCALPSLSCPGTTACVNVLSDPANCGACQSRCPADATCVQGACQPRCPTGFVSCAFDGGAGACANLQRDPFNCGGCGQACATGEICREGGCGLTCPEGQVLCTGSTGRLCAELRSDNRNCGACGQVCAAGKSCHAGRCDDCRMTMTFSERDWVLPMAPLQSSYLFLTPRVSGDFDGDRKLDLAVDLGYGQIRMLLGDGTGQLAPGALTTLTTIPGTNALAALDVNRDGKLDLVALTRDSPSKLLVLLGKGDGRFDEQTALPLPADVTFMTSGDVNADGVPDLLLAGNAQSSSRVYSGIMVVLVAADGSMRVSDQQPVGAVKQAPVIAELTGDGIPDLALAQSDRILIMRGLGQGLFERGNAFFESWYNLAVAAADLDHDGKPELIALGRPPTDAGESTASLGVVDGATGRIRETSTDLPTALPDLFVGDVDRDGNLDLIVGNVINSGKDVWVLAGKGDGSLVPGPRQELRATDITLGDFNGDQRPDLVVGTPAIGVCLGLDNGLFATPANRTPAIRGFVDAADVDGDGHADLIATNQTSVTVLRGKGNGSFQPAVVGAYKVKGGRPAVADFDADGRADVCCEDRALLMGQRDGSLLGMTALPSSSSLRWNLMARDLDGDGILDLISPENTSVCLFRARSRLSFPTYQSYETLVAMDFGAVAVGDVDGDHIQDIVAAVSGQSAVVILYGKADGSYENPVKHESGPTPATVALSDWNGDGRLDIVVADAGGLQTFQNRGQRSWAPRFAVTGTTNVKRLLSVDWDGDGVGDLLAIAPGYATTAILSRGDGRFEATTLDSAGTVYDAAVADLDHDGRADIAISDDGLSLRVFLQKGVTCAK